MGSRDDTLTRVAATTYRRNAHARKASATDDQVKPCRQYIAIAIDSSFRPSAGLAYTK